jgi:hypothetical protein
MSPHEDCSPAEAPRPAPVEIAEHARAGAEGVIEEFRRRGESVEVDLLLADGSDATALVHVHDWEWLELRAGDIVPVRAVACTAFSE